MILLRMICLFILFLTGNIFCQMFCVTASEAAIQCYQCHGSTGDYRPIDAPDRDMATGGFVGNHRTHMDSPASPSACEPCHPGSASYTSSHRDGRIKLSARINSSRPLTTYKNITSAFPQSSSPVPGSCANVNCHFESATPNWGSSSAATGCSTCHGAPPNGTASTYSGGAAGSHTIHGTYYSGLNGCAKCHADHTGDPKPFAHATSGGRRGLVVQPRTPSNVPSGSYAAVFTPITGYLPSKSATHAAKLGSCLGTYCHGTSMSVSNDMNGGTNITPTWGNAVTGQCGTCHGASATSPPLRGSHKTHVSSGLAYFPESTPNPPLVPGYNYIYGRNLACTVCHNNHSSTHVNGKLEWSFDSTGKPALSGAVYRGISSGSATPVPAATYGQCANLYCHSIVQTATGGNLTGQPGEYKTPAWGNVNDGRCGSCHAVDYLHGSVYGGLPADTPEISSGSHTRHLQSLGTTPGGPARCANCHNYAGDNGLNGCASVCHNGNSLHVDQKIDVKFPPMYSSGLYDGSTAAGDGFGDCSAIACHGNTSARWGGSACLGCHSVPQGNRAAITSQFASGSHHIQGTLTDAHCYQCHWEANGNGTINPLYHAGKAGPGAAINLVVYGSGSRPTFYSSTSAVLYSANGSSSEIAKISNHCLGCHSNGNNAAIPFGDGKTPKQYAWDGTSVAARYSQTTTTSWGKYTSATYSNTARKKVEKAYSAHGRSAANQRGWNTTSGVDGTIANSSGSASVQCYDCHNSHGSAVSGITSRYSSATGRNRGGILKQTVRGFGGYSATYAPTAGGSALDKSLRNPGASLCLDCHLGSTPKQAPLAAFKGYTTPWGYSSTYGSNQPIIGYWDSPYMGRGPSGSEQRYPFKGVRDSMGGHFGASSTLSGTTASTINGLCTPCHDPHGVSPALGSKQQYSVPLLKGTWLTSPYMEDTAPANGYDMYITGGTGLPFHLDQNTFGGAINNVPVAGLPMNDTSLSAGLCLECHTKAALTNGSSHAWKSKDRVHEAVKGWKSANGTTQHSFTCSKCHSAHTSSVLPRLMVTNCLDSIHKGRSSLNLTTINANGGIGDYGSGSGRIPGIYSGSGDCIDGGPACGTSFMVSCHEGNTGNGADQSWNTVTPWAIASPPPSPALTDQPDAGSSGGDRNSPLQWSAVTCPSGAATQYLVEISANPSFAPVSYSSDWQAGVSWTQALPIGAWYWRVTARDSNFTAAQSAPSSYDTFSISYAAPVPPALTPQTGSSSSGGAISKTFQWSTVVPTDVDSMQYLVEVSGTSDFAAITYQSGWQSGTSWIQAIAVGTWYWRVSSRDSLHTSAVSAPSGTNSFSITLTSPSAPALVAQPATTYTSGTHRSITFQWNPVTAPDGDACQYLVQVSNNPGFSPVTYVSDWQAGASWSQVVPIGSWYWRVTSRDAVHTTSVSSPSVAGGFGIAYAPPPAPTLIAQPNYSSGVNVDVTFQWNPVAPTDADAIEYYVEVSATADFASIAYQSAWQTAATWTQSVAPGTWHWRTRARDSVHTSAVSDPSNTNSFTISGGPLPPIAPVLISQTGGNTVCTTSYAHTLQWNPVTAPDGHAVEYFLQLDTVPGFDSANLQQPGWVTATNWTTPSLAASTWYWRVKARDAVDTAMESSYSDNLSFIDTYNWDCTCDNSCATSCPILFTWDGGKYALESDIYPAGKLGNRDPKGFRRSNPFDYYLLSASPALKDGKLELRLVEEKVEANYLDTVKLYAVDIPDNRDLHAERLPITGGTYVAPGSVIHTTSRELKKPLSVKHLETGEEISGKLSASGNSYVVLSRDRNSGFGWQTLEIDLGDLSGAPMIKLIIDGATAFPNTHEGHEIANKFLAKSKIEVLDHKGNWVAVPMRERSIVPRDGGGPTAINLTNAFKSKVYKLRIKYLYKTYIRSILFDTTADEPALIGEVPLSSAELGFHGHDASTSVNKGEVVKFIYGTRNDIPPTYMPGYYTRFGDVTPLLKFQDDKFAIFGSGDEIVLRFDQTAKGPKGTSRRYLLYSNGYYKSLSNRNVSPTVEPLPFAGMSNFPYDESLEGYPQDSDHLDYIGGYNTRMESGIRKESRTFQLGAGTAFASNIEEISIAGDAGPRLARLHVARPEPAMKSVPSGPEKNIKTVPGAGGVSGAHEPKPTIWTEILGYASRVLSLFAAAWEWIIHLFSR